VPNDDLDAWIAELRARLDRGDLAALGPVDVGDGTDILPAEHTVRLMLADLDSFDELSPAERMDPCHVTRRQQVLDEFRRLHDLIG